MKSKKVIKSATCFAIVLSVMLSLTVLSYAGSLSRTYSGQFTEDWSKAASYTTSTGAKAYLTYGFDTTLIHEDIASSLFYGSEHNARIKNGRGTFNGPVQDAGDYSDLEVTHSGSTVTYYSIW